jgi:hypothetical protein
MQEEDKLKFDRVTRTESKECEICNTIKSEKFYKIHLKRGEIKSEIVMCKFCFIKYVRNMQRKYEVEENKVRAVIKITNMKKLPNNCVACKEMGCTLGTLKNNQDKVKEKYQKTRHEDCPLRVESIWKR